MLGEFEWGGGFYRGGGGICYYVFVGFVYLFFDFRLIVVVEFRGVFILFWKWYFLEKVF